MRCASRLSSTGDMTRMKRMRNNKPKQQRDHVIMWMILFGIAALLYAR